MASYLTLFWKSKKKMKLIAKFKGVSLYNSPGMAALNIYTASC